MMRHRKVRTALGLAASVLASGAVVLSAHAQQQFTPRSGPPGARQPSAPAIDRCADRSRTLGVSRVVDIDTTTGPRFGHQQYKDINLLQDGEIVLTFDDGPLRATTQAVVNALDEQCTKGTFFMVGSQALADPDMVRQIMRKGHTVANHTWSHADLRKMTPLKARHEIELGFSAVTLAAGQPIAPFFRFPFLADTTAMKQMATSRSFGIFSIEIDALDYRNKENPQAVHDEVMKQLTYARKGILLFHDIQPSTAGALPGLLAAIRAKGFKIVHMKPTAPMETLPEFDAIARKEAQAKRVALGANPLANRAVTWPAPSKQSQQPGDVAPQPQPAAVPPPLYIPPPQAPAPQRDPYAGSVFQPPPQVRPPPRRPQDDWRNRVLNGG